MSAISNPARVSALQKIVQRISGRQDQPTSLLAVCPNSDAVARAAVLAAVEANAPILFAATLNQVDVGGGYTGMSPEDLVTFVRDEVRTTDGTVPIFPCLDHGGPWLKDTHTINGYSYEETMAAVKESLEACLDAGYALLHIDPTVDRTLPPGEPIPIDLVVDRTLELIAHAESYRRDRGYPPISYEVGTEEVHGGLANMESFDAFLSGLDTGLKARDLEEAWPCFVVGKVGTDLHTSYFEPGVAKTLTEHVRPYGALIKGHYTDYVENPEDYPLSGMGGANVGPEFTEEEYRALMDLVALERKIGHDSGLKQALKKALVDSGRWEKWRRPDEEGLEFDELRRDRREWLIRTGSRYIWTEPPVEAARRRLYDTLDGLRDADAYVLWRIKTSIMTYFHAFNLIDFNRVIADIPGVTQYQVE